MTTVFRHVDICKSHIRSCSGAAPVSDLLWVTLRGSIEPEHARLRACRIQPTRGSRRRHCTRLPASCGTLASMRFQRQHRHPRSSQQTGPCRCTRVVEPRPTLRVVLPVAAVSGGVARPRRAHARGEGAARGDTRARRSASAGSRRLPGPWWSSLTAHWSHNKLYWYGNIPL